MIPPKYQFYLGWRDTYAKFIKGTLISDSGAYYSQVNGYATDMAPIDEGFSKIWLSVTPANVITAVFFYDASKTYLSRVDFSRVNGIADIPEGAKFFGIRTTIQDTAIVQAIEGEVDFVNVMRACTPHYKNLSKKYAKENGQEFFRVTLDGQLNFFGSDFDFINGMDLETQFVFLIRKFSMSSEAWAEYYRGEFTKMDCQLDLFKKKCEVQMQTFDDYDKILDKYDNTFDLIKLAPGITRISMYKRSVVQVYVQGADSVSNFFGGNYWEQEVTEPVDDASALTDTYHFNFERTGNELYVEGAKVSGVDGIYAGINGEWINWNGFTCYAKMTGSTGYIYIKRTSDGTDLYKSQEELTFLNTDNIHLERDVTMVSLTDSSDKFTLQAMFIYPIFCRLLCDVDKVGTAATYDVAPDDFAAGESNLRKCVPLTGSLLFCTSRVVDTPTKYGINDDGKYFTNEFLPLSTGNVRPMPIGRSTWANASLWYGYGSTFNSYETGARKKFTLRDSYSIAAVIKALLKKVDPSIQHEGTAEYSQFLYSSTSPLNINRFYVFITPKSNILKSEYDQAAQKAEVSLEDIMNMLRDCFQCYWYLDGKKLKIEHISYFKRGGRYAGSASVQLDFTKLTDQFNKEELSRFQSAVEYDKDELPARYEFNWMDDVTDLFGQVSIDVKVNYVQKDKTEEINIGQFSSDVDLMMLIPSNFSEDGFALLCPTKSGSNYTLPVTTVRTLKDENGDSYSATIQNWYASLLYLIRLYMYDMPARSIEISSISGWSVQDVKKSMSQTVEFISEDDPDVVKLITTEYGDGQIDEVEIDIDTRKASVTLLYEPR